ncbi:MAG: phytoene desaturase family protein [Flavipsychrobacter sp.]|nr:phytoene desaturase family protein [Flavipsychrobacter sp.]
MKQHVAIIGAGVAGLATAARLAVKGYSVSIYEQNSKPGGKLGLLKLNGYTWDTGPSLFTQPHLLQQLFTDCGKDIGNYLHYKILAINTRYFYEDGTLLISYKNRLQLGPEIKAKLDIDPDDLFKFLDEIKEMYAHIGSIFLNQPIHSLCTWWGKPIVTALRKVKLPYLFSSMHQYHVRSLRHPKLVQLFDRFATYNGSNPYSAPAVLCMIAHLEMNEGAYYPAGGMISIADALYNLCKDLGVSFHFDTLVQKIEKCKHSVTGITTANGTIPADIVVSNSDVYFTYKNLLGDGKKAQKIKQQERSSSAVIFYWGINRSLKQLGLHNIFFAEDYKAEFNAIFNTHQVYHDPTVYVNITCKMEASHAPDGCENWFVLVNTPDERYITSEDITAIRKNIIDKLTRILGKNIEPYITNEEVLSPDLIAKQTSSYLGALYGTASNNKIAAFLRHSNVSSAYRNLFFAGGTVHPGGGIPLCLRSAKLVADAIEK